MTNNIPAAVIALADVVTEETVAAVVTAHKTDGAARVRALAPFIATGASSRVIADVLNAREDVPSTISHNTVARAAVVLSYLTADGMPSLKTEDVDYIAAELYTLVSAGKTGRALADDIAARAAQCKTGRSAVKVVRDAIAAEKRTTRAEASARVDALIHGKTPAPTSARAGTPNRVTGAEKNTGETDTEETTTPAPASALSSASVAGLIAELHRRINARGFTPDAVIVDAFDAMAADWEAVTVSAGGVLATA